MMTTDLRSSFPLPAPRAAHGGMTVSRYYADHFLGAVLPVTAGVLLYGWRAAATIALSVGSAAVAIAVWRRIGSRGRQVHVVHALWLALLIGLMLPAHVASTTPDNSGRTLWPIAVVAGVGVVMLLWAWAGSGSGGFTRSRSYSWL